MGYIWLLVNNKSITKYYDYGIVVATIIITNNSINTYYYGYCDT
jgi:hypothetical protein